MQASTRTTTRSASPSAGSARIISSYTCPRCRQYGQSARCPRCGWTPNAASLASAAMDDHEDRIIAC